MLSTLARIRLWALLLSMFLPLLLARTPLAYAVEIPPVGSAIFIQTNGPDADIAYGDWYSSRTNGVGGGYHYFGINVPCRWPANLDFQIDLYSPEINTFPRAMRNDEVYVQPPDATTFELYAPGVLFTPPALPGPGDAGSIRQVTYAPVAGRAELWERFYTLAAPVTCGKYVLRAATSVDDQNGWRLRVGSDDDPDPNNALPANSDNPDGQPGTGDETTVSIDQTTYQHDQRDQVLCLLIYEFVRPNLNQVSFHNFDLDGNERVTYYPPSAVFNDQGNITPGSIRGTVSANRLWNGGTQTDRGSGDSVLNPEAGWWRIVTCVRNQNQFNQEGLLGVPSFREPTPEPDMALRKTDGRTIVAAGELLTYTISFFNQSLSTKPVPGAAFDVVLADELPPNTSFVGCRLVSSGLAGNCALRGQTVVFDIDDPVVAGQNGELEVTVRVNSGASGQVLNRVALDYTDTLSNPYPTVYAEDLDLLQDAVSPTIDVTKSARISLDGNGNGLADPDDMIEYTIGVSNTGQVDATSVLLRDTPDPNTRLITGTVRIDPPGGLVLSGNGFGDRSVEVQLGTIAPGSSVRVLFDVQVNASLPSDVTTIVNQGTLRGDNLPDIPTDDPRTPAPDDPTTLPVGPPPNSGPPTTPPTAIELLDLDARAEGGLVTLRWTTGVELASVGFTLLRAPTAARTAATPLSGLIPARGSGGSGASYEWRDRTALPGKTYHYWLVEHAIDGTIAEYGPAAVKWPATTAERYPYRLYIQQLGN